MTHLTVKGLSGGLSRNSHSNMNTVQRFRLLRALSKCHSGVVRVFAGCGAFNKPASTPPGKTHTTHQTNHVPPFHFTTSVAKWCESRVHFTIKGVCVCWTAAMQACRCHGTGSHISVGQRRHQHVTAQIFISATNNLLWAVNLQLKKKKRRSTISFHITIWIGLQRLVAMLSWKSRHGSSAVAAILSLATSHRLRLGSSL